MRRRPVVSFTVVLLVLAVVFGVAVSPASASISPSSFSLVLTFYGASSSSCGTGGNIGFSTSVTFGGGISHTQVATVTDGKGTVLYSQSGPDFADGTYGSYGGFAYGTAPWINPITATVVYDGVTYTGKADNPCLPPSGGPYLAAPVPSGFVLRTITCDVAVYSSAGGTPVGDNKVTAGQTWFVSTTPVQAADGQSWTEIFVAGLIDGFVPTSCVQ